MPKVILVTMLFTILVIYLFLSPRDTFAELKLIFDRRVIRRGLRFRIPRRLPRIKLPQFRYSIFGLLAITTAVAVYSGFMRQQQESLSGIVGSTVVLLVCCGIVVLAACNATERGVLRKQREEYLPSTSGEYPGMQIEVDTSEPRHVSMIYDEQSFPEVSLREATDETLSD
jgi:hypothetical protein